MLWPFTCMSRSASWRRWASSRASASCFRRIASRCSALTKKPSKHRWKTACSSLLLAYTACRASRTVSRSPMSRTVRISQASAVSWVPTASPSPRSMAENSASFST